MAVACRLAKKKNAFVINKDTITLMDDIMPGISKAIQFNEENRQFLLDSLEMGHFGNIANVNDVVAFEIVGECKECPTGYNLWSMGNQEKAAKRVIIKSETEIFTKFTHDEIIFFDNIEDTIEFIKERSTDGYLEKNVVFEDNTIIIHTKYGDAKGTLGNCYVICHGQDSMQVLTVGAPTLDDLYIFSMYNSDIQKLVDMAKSIEYTKPYNKIPKDMKDDKIYNKFHSI